MNETRNLLLLPHHSLQTKLTAVNYYWHTMMGCKWIEAWASRRWINHVEVRNNSWGIWGPTRLIMWPLVCTEDLSTRCLTVVQCECNYGARNLNELEIGGRPAKSFWYGIDTGSGHAPFITTSSTWTTVPQEAEESLPHRQKLWLRHQLKFTPEPSMGARRLEMRIMIYQITYVSLLSTHKFQTNRGSRYIGLGACAQIAGINYLYRYMEVSRDIQLSNNERGSDGRSLLSAIHALVLLVNNNRGGLRC